MSNEANFPAHPVDAPRHREQLNMIQERNLDIIVSLLLICLGIYIIWSGLGYGYALDGVPEAGFFPLWMGIGLVGSCGVNLYRIHARRAIADGASIAASELGRAAGTLVLMAAFIGASFVIGMRVSLFLLMVSLGVLFGPREKRFYVAITVISLVVTGLLHWVFQNLLGVPLI